jgi:hypothetical protein
MDNHVKDAMEWSRTTQKVEVTTLTSEQKAKWNAKLQGLTEKWAVEAKGKGLPADQIIGDIKALITKYSK